MGDYRVSTIRFELLIWSRENGNFKLFFSFKYNKNRPPQLAKTKIDTSWQDHSNQNNNTFKVKPPVNDTPESKW